MKRKLLTLRTTTFAEQGVASYKELWERVKSAGMMGLEVIADAEFTKSEDGKKYHAVFSTDVEDRHREIVYQDFEVRSFKKNPVFIDSHNYFGIEYVLGSISNLKSKKGEPLEGDIEFATVNPRGALAEKMVEGKFIRATSIGFIPLAFDEKGNILKSELLEVSLVSVPANPEALFDGKSLDGESGPAESGASGPEGESGPAASGAEAESGPSGAEAESGPSGATGPAESGPAQTGPAVNENSVAAAMRELSKSKRETLQRVAAELQQLVAPGARKRELMKDIRSLILDTQK